MTTSTKDIATPPRATVSIPNASGDEVEAWVYRPGGEGPHPAVVMAHGLAAVKAGGLEPFAERFCRDGFTAVAFDYRNGAARPACLATRRPSRASVRTTARSSTGRSLSPTSMRRRSSSGARHSRDCMWPRSPRRTLDCAAQSPRTRSSTDSPA
jgi:dienelactone hydrolase